MKVYLDNCCFNRPYDEQIQTKIILETEAKLKIQEKIRARELTLIWSYILEKENDDNPDDKAKDTIAEWRNFADTKFIASEIIIIKAQEFEKYGIHPNDSLHIACAIQGGAEIFSTTDKNIMNKSDKITQIRIMNPMLYFLE